jgi:hypothetical protein
LAICSGIAIAPRVQYPSELTVASITLGSDGVEDDKGLGASAGGLVGGLYRPFVGGEADTCAKLLIYLAENGLIIIGKSKGV